jgi:hypothetical protein
VNGCTNRDLEAWPDIAPIRGTANGEICPRGTRALHSRRSAGATDERCLFSIAINRYKSAQGSPIRQAASATASTSVRATGTPHASRFSSWVKPPL